MEQCPSWEQRNEKTIALVEVKTLKVPVTGGDTNEAKIVLEKAEM
jgi:hypothetical protein